MWRLGKFKNHNFSFGFHPVYLLTPCFSTLFTFDNDNDKQSDAGNLEKLDKWRIMIETSSPSRQ